MTVETQSGGLPILKSGPYNGNGVTAVFDYDFPIQSNAEIVAVRQNADLTVTTLTLTTHYTVAGVGVDAGGQVTIVDPATNLPTGTKLLLRYAGDFLQDVDWSNQSAIQLSQLEDALDKVTMHLRQMQERIDRTVAVDEFSEISDLDALTANIAALGLIEAQITAVAAIASEVATVAGDSADIVTVAGLTAEIAAVIAIAADIAAVAAIDTDVTAVAAVDTEVVTLAAIAADITALASGIGGTLSGLWTFSSTSHLNLPGGTTAQRPGSPVVGDFRQNNSIIGLPEVYDGAQWLTLLGTPDGGALGPGDLIYYDQSIGDFKRLAKGTTGQVLTQGAVNPAWATIASEGMVKAFVGEYDQTVPTTKTVYNVSSITDVSAGFSTDNFTNSFADADYCVVGAHSNTANPVGMTWATSDDKTTALCDIRARAANTGTFGDTANQNRLYLGDLA